MVAIISRVVDRLEILKHAIDRKHWPVAKQELRFLFRGTLFNEASNNSGSSSNASGPKGEKQNALIGAMDDLSALNAFDSGTQGAAVVVEGAEGPNSSGDGAVAKPPALSGVLKGVGRRRRRNRIPGEPRSKTGKEQGAHTGTGSGVFGEVCPCSSRF